MLLQLISYIYSLQISSISAIRWMLGCSTSYMYHLSLVVTFILTPEPFYFFTLESLASTPVVVGFSFFFFKWFRAGLSQNHHCHFQLRGSQQSLDWCSGLLGLWFDQDVSIEEDCNNIMLQWDCQHIRLSPHAPLPVIGGRSVFFSCIWGLFFWCVFTSLLYAFHF